MVLGCGSFSASSWRATEAIQSLQASVVLLSRIDLSSWRDLKPGGCDNLLAELQKEFVFTGLLLDGGLVITTHSAVPTKEAASGLHLLAVSAPAIRKNDKGSHAVVQLICSSKLLSPERFYATNKSLGVTIIACEDLSLRSQQASVACNVSSLSRSHEIGSVAFLLVYCFTSLRVARGKVADTSSSSNPCIHLSWKLAKGRVVKGSSAISDATLSRNMAIQMPRSRSLLPSKHEKAANGSGRQQDFIIPSSVMFSSNGGVCFIVDHGTRSKSRVKATPIDVVLEWMTTINCMTDTSIRLPPISLPNESSSSELSLPYATGPGEFCVQTAQLTQSVFMAHQSATTEPFPQPATGDSATAVSMDTCKDHQLGDSLDVAGSMQPAPVTSACEAVEASVSTEQVEATNANTDGIASVVDARPLDVKSADQAPEVPSECQMPPDAVESGHGDSPAPMQSTENQKLSPEELKARIMGYGNTSTLMKRQSARGEVAGRVSPFRRATDVQIVGDIAKDSNASSSSTSWLTQLVDAHGKEGRGSGGDSGGEKGTVPRTPVLWRFGSTGQQAAAVASAGATSGEASQKTPLNSLPTLQMFVGAPVAVFAGLGSRMSGAMVELQGAFKKDQDSDLKLAEMREADKKKAQEQEVRRQVAYKNAAASLFKTTHPSGLEHPQGDQAALVNAGDILQATAEISCNAVAVEEHADKKESDEGTERNDASGRGAEVSKGKEAGDADGNEGRAMEAGTDADDHATALSGSLSMFSSGELKADLSSEIVVGARSSDGSNKSSEQSIHRHSGESATSRRSTEPVQANKVLLPQASIGRRPSGGRRPRMVLGDNWYKVLADVEPGRRLMAAQLAREAMLVRGWSGDVSRLDGRVGGVDAPTPLGSRMNSGVPLAFKEAAVPDILHEGGEEVVEGISGEAASAVEEGEVRVDGFGVATQDDVVKHASDAVAVSVPIDTAMEKAGDAAGSSSSGAQASHSVGQGSLVGTAGLDGCQQSCQGATASQNPVAMKKVSKPEPKADPPVDKRLQSGFDGLLQAVESLATMSVARSPGAKPWASSNHGAEGRASSQSTGRLSPVLPCDEAVGGQGKRHTDLRQPAASPAKPAGGSRQTAQLSVAPHANSAHNSTSGFRFPAALPQNTEDFANKAGVLSLQQQATWLWGSAEHMAARGTRARNSSTSSDGDPQSRNSSAGSGRASGRVSGLSDLPSARNSSNAVSSGGTAAAGRWSQQGATGQAPVAEELLSGRSAYEYLKGHQKECAHLGPRTPH